MDASDWKFFGEQEDMKSSKLKRYVIGCILWTAATIMKAFSMVLSQMLDGILGEFELNIGRFASMLILIIPLLLKQQPYIIVAKKNRIPTLLLCLSLFGVNYVNYAATIYIPSGTANTAIEISYMLSTLLISTILILCTEGRLHYLSFMYDSITILMLTFGIIFVVQPGYIFGLKPHTRYKSFCNPLRFGSQNSTIFTDAVDNSSVFLENMQPKHLLHDNASFDSFMGYFYAVCAGFLYSIFVFLGKYIFKTELPIVVCTWLSVINSLLSILCTALFESFVFPDGIFCQIVLAFHAMFTGFMTVFCFLAMSDVPGTDLSVISSLSVPTVFVFQFSVLKNASPTYTVTNTLSIIAAAFMSLVSILKPLIEGIRLHNDR